MSDNVSQRTIHSLPIVAVGRSANKSAELLNRWVLALRLVTLVVGVTALLAPPANDLLRLWWVLGTALTGLVSEVVAYALSRIAREWHSTGRAALRRAMLVSARYLTEDHPEVANLKTARFAAGASRWLDERIADGKTPDASDFYSTREPGSAERLLDTLYEGSLWWKELASQVARRHIMALIAFIGIVAISFVYSVLEESREARELLLLLLCQVGLFLLTAELVGGALDWFNCASQASSLHDKLTHLDELPEALLCLYFADYVVLAHSVPPVPLFGSLNLQGLDDRCKAQLRHREDRRARKRRASARTRDMPQATTGED